jgi:SAM-dependent methyltransferase
MLTSEATIDLGAGAASRGRHDRGQAWFLRAVDDLMHRKYGPLKRDLFGGLPRDVVEIGAGAGANFRYLARGTRVVALEPNLALHDTLREVAARRGVAVDVRDAVAEELPLADASADAVISSLVLCTVASPERAVAEIRRVLRPGGRLWALEHVAAAEGTAMARFQRLVRRPWGHLLGGCDPHRDTARVLQQAGFASVELTRLTIRSAFVPIWPHLVAVAVR